MQSVMTEVNSSNHDFRIFTGHLVYCELIFNLFTICQSSGSRSELQFIIIGTAYEFLFSGITRENLTHTENISSQNW